jgi:hypothetical protein
MGTKPFEPKGDVARWVLIYEGLRDLDPDTVVTYEELSEWAGINIRLDRSPVRRAEKELLDKHQRALTNEREVGYRVMHASEHGGAARYQTKKANRRIRTAIDLLTKADRNELTPQQGQVYDAQAGALQAVSDITRRLSRRQDRLEEGLKAARKETQAVRRETKETTAELADKVEKQEQALNRLQQMLTERSQTPTS